MNVTIWLVFNLVFLSGIVLESHVFTLCFRLERAKSWIMPGSFSSMKRCMNRNCLRHARGRAPRVDDAHREQFEACMQDDSLLSQQRKWIKTYFKNSEKAAFT